MIDFKTQFFHITFSIFFNIFSNHFIMFYGGDFELSIVVPAQCKSETAGYNGPFVNKLS